MGIAYGKTGVLAIKAIQEQQLIVEKQQLKIDEFETDWRPLKNSCQIHPP